MSSMGMISKPSQWKLGQIGCLTLLSLSITSGLILLILLFTKILPSTKKKNISIRIPKLMVSNLYITAWILLIAIPVTSSLFCFVDIRHTTNDNYIAAILFTMSIIPLIITHISRFGLLRIQHGISNATMAFNLGEITWHQYLDKFEIILQEDYSITNPSILRKYSLYVSLIICSLSIIVILLTHPFFYTYINAILLGIASVLTALIVWTKSDNFNIKDLSNRFKLDSYSILKEMHIISIYLLILSIVYLTVCITLHTFGTNECEGTVLTHLVLCIGLTVIWSAQLKYALRALFRIHKAVPLTQLLSSYDGYKAFLRFLVSELSIENLEFFQLSMRWRYRICCWRYGTDNGVKEPAENINLPFKIFSFQYVDRLLPQQNGGGLVPNYREQKAQQNGLEITSRDSEVFFTTLPMSRKASVNSQFKTPYASNKNSRTTTPKFGAMHMGMGAITAQSSLHHALPPTIIESPDEEEMEYTRTATTTYMLQAPYDEDIGTNGAPEYSHISQSLKNNDSLKSNKLEVNMAIPMKIPAKDMRNNNSTSTNKSPLSPLTITAISPNSTEECRLRKIPREDEIIQMNTPGTMVQREYTPPIFKQRLMHMKQTNADSDDTNTNISGTASRQISLHLNDVTTEPSEMIEIGDKQLTNRVFKPPLIATDTDTETQTTVDRIDLTPVQMKPDPLSFKTAQKIVTEQDRAAKETVDTPNTPEPNALNLPDIDLDTIDISDRKQLLTDGGQDMEMDKSEDEDGMEYIDYHEYQTPIEINEQRQNSKKKLVRFANTPITENANTPIKAVQTQVTMKDLLGGHGSDMTKTAASSDVEVLPLERAATDTYVQNSHFKSTNSDRDVSVVSKAGEPSWFAAWFRKGSVQHGQEERADTLLHYSDLSWRRMRKVTREVNMSASARGSVDALFRKYINSRQLEIKGITLEEYDLSMRDAWVGCWENMNDSLRRFAKSVHYEEYLKSIGQMTIRRVTTDHDYGQEVEEENVNDEKVKKKLTFRRRGKSKTADHARAPAVVIT